MAGKVNTKFVIILTLVLIAVTGALGGAWYIATRQDPAEFVARGDVMMQQQNYEQAAQYYGRALREDQTSPLIMLKYTEAASQIPVDTTHALNERLQRMLSIWRKIADVAPNSSQAVEAQRRLMDYYARAAAAFGHISYWNQVYTVANDIINNARTTDESKALARKYRAIAQVNRAGRIDLDAQAAADATEDLQAARQAEPDDAELAYAQAQWQLRLADYARRDNKPEQAAEHKAKAVELAQTFRENHPDDPEAALNLARIYYATRQFDPATEILNQLESEVAASGQVDLMLHVGGLLAIVDRKIVEHEAGGGKTINGRLREEALIREALSQHPDNIRVQYELAENLTKQGRPAEAIAHLLDAIETRPATPTLDAQRDAYLQLMAIDKLADVYLAQRERSTDPSQRQDMLAKTRQLLEKMRQLSNESSAQVDLLEGKIAMAEGDFGVAEQKLNAANDKFSSGKPEILILQARALRQLGQLGAARDRLSQALNMPAGRRYWQVYRELALLELQLNQPDMAMEHVQTVLDAVPGDVEARKLKAQVLAEQFRTLASSSPKQAASKLKDAIATLETLPNPDDRGVRIQLARLYQLTARTDEVRALLEPIFEADPQDFVVLRELLRSDLAADDKPTAVARIEKSLAGDNEPKVEKALTMMRDRLTDQPVENVSGQIEDLLASEEDPFQRAMWLYSFNLQAGQRDKALAALDEAEKLKADHPSVMRARFELAISDRRWNDAEKIAERAGKLNLDEAQGMFWIGELELKRDRFTQAVATLNRGVNLRPRYSDGWRLLGQARLNADDLVGAEAALKRALELRPNNLAALKVQFKLQDERRNYQLALQTLEKAVDFAPRDRSLYETYLNYLAEHGDRQRALTLREALAEQRPGDQTNRRALAELYEQMGQPDKARAQLDAVMSGEQGQSLANVVAMAKHHRQRGAVDAGRKLLVDYIASKGDQARAVDWMALGRYLREAGRPDQAEAAYRRGIAVEDKSVMPATRELGDWMFAREQHAKAAALYGPLLEVTREPRVARRYVETLVRSGQYEQAHEQLRKFITQHGQDVQTALLEGLILSHLHPEEPERATRAFDRAVQLGQGNAQAYLYRARHHFQADDAQLQAQVKSDLQRAVDLDPTLLTARRLLIGYYLDPRRNDVPSAITEFRRAIEQTPDDAGLRVQLAELYLQRETYPELNRLLDESIRQHSEMMIWHQLRANAYRKQGQNDKAVDVLAEAFKQQPSASMLVQYADALLADQRPDQALSLLDKHPDAVGQLASLQALRGQALAQLDRAEQAVGAFTAAFRQAQGDARQINTVVERMRQVFSADRLISLLDKQAAEDATGLTDLVIAQMLAEQGQLSSAAQRLTELGRRVGPDNPLHAPMLQLHASVYYQLQQYDKAWPIYEKLLKVTPDNVSVLNNAAYLLAEELDQPARALSLAQRAVELAPKEPIAQASILDTLGWVQFRNGSVDQAEVTLRRSLAQHPLAPVHLHLARVLIDKSQTDAARRQIEAARGLAEQKQDADMIKEAEQLLKSLDPRAAQGAASP